MADKRLIALTATMAMIAAGTNGATWTIGVADDSWQHRTPSVRIDRDTLELDRLTPKGQALTVHMPVAVSDPDLRASFRVDAAGDGVRAVGFVFGAVDSLNYHYVHYDRTQAILCCSDDVRSWHELGRRSGLSRAAGEWHRGRVECRGRRVTVYLNDEVLFDCDAPLLQPGRIGFYAGQARARVKDIELEGKPAEVAAWQWRKRQQPWRLVCEDGGNGGYEAFPDLCRLADGRLMTVFYDGYTHVSVPSEQCPGGGRISACYSRDEGRTWTEPSVVFDGPLDDRDPHVTQLRDGRIMITFFCHRPPPKSRWSGPQLMESRNGGDTWSDPAGIAPGYYVSAPVRELAEGVLVLGLYGNRNGEAFGAVTRSTDGGATWMKPFEIDSNGMQLDAETDILELRNGELLAALRGRQQLAWSRSGDRGVTWTPAVSAGFPGHCPIFLRTVRDVILMAHRLPATSLHFSLDEGESWNGPVLIDSTPGAYPGLAQLNDGSVLCVYYEEGAGSNIRASRLTASPDNGVKVIGFDR